MSETVWVTRLKVWHIFAFLIIVCLLTPLLYTTSFAEYIVLLGVFLSLIPITGVFGYLLLKILERLKEWKRAEEEELQREDDVFLKGIAFSQSTLFIILNLVQPFPLTEYLRWAVPFFALVFFVARGYAKIKQSPKLRFISSILALLILFLNIYIAIISILPGFAVAGFDITFAYWLWISVFFFVLIAKVISEGLKRRYGC